MYFLDSCTCIDLMRGALPHTFNLMRKSSPKMFGIPSMVAAELFTGAEKSARPTKTRYEVERFLAPFNIVEFDEKAARSYAIIRAKLEKNDKKIGSNDLVIAACALSRGATIVTSNVREFQRVDGLSVECWEEAAW